ncbi:hypothetical protein QWY87_11525 [Lutimonas halocynthiae]|uniref:hypothetical protein n=1 Tax=Lutimonas halocynthiae TaxID=1446477 RepID=UPI0025B3E8B3|nr:hypothetical protein [Lutimonas halocynthiae]MDN3643336.1 hypothetical protein [Lutimonas halocynthiae]
MVQMYNYILLLMFLIGSLHFSNVLTQKNSDKYSYTQYHQKVILAETFVAREALDSALVVYKDIFKTYDYVLLREYQLATQLAIKLKKDEEAALFLRGGIETGWTKKSIKNNELLKPWLDTQDGKAILLDYDKYHESFEQGVNDTLAAKVHDMFKRDQKLAIKALFKLSSASQDKYAEKKFAPHSEKQMAQLLIILNQVGYPGGRLIGNDMWMSIILSHHNSISQKYVQKDTLYPQLRPLLIEAIDRGEMQPVDFAFIEEWRMATMTEPSEVSYGFLEAPFAKSLTKTDSLRAAIGLRSVQLRNDLVEVQNKTGIDMYLFGSPWVDGKIEMR